MRRPIKGETALTAIQVAAIQPSHRAARELQKLYVDAEIELVQKMLDTLTQMS
jgi:hypothetical protein